jgi:hypothetical protein
MTVITNQSDEPLILHAPSRRRLTRALYAANRAETPSGFAAIVEALAQFQEGLRMDEKVELLDTP